MNGIKRARTMARRIVWTARRLAGLRPAGIVETLDRLARRRDGPPTAAGEMAVPWGRLEFADFGNARTQLWEIFIDRQYAFSCDDGEAPVIVDCGGNMGISAIWFKQHYPRCTLTVYEADPALAALLARNLAHAGVTDVDVRAEAVWISDGRIGFDRTGRPDRRAVDPAGPDTVPSVDLSARLPERVDLLKMDIEGAEFAVLDRLCVTGAIHRVRRLVVEFHVRRQTTGALLSSLDRLREAGFTVVVGRAFLSSAVGPPESKSPFELLADRQSLLEVYAWAPAR